MESRSTYSSNAKNHSIELCTRPHNATIQPIILAVWEHPHWRKTALCNLSLPQYLKSLRVGNVHYSSGCDVFNDAMFRQCFDKNIAPPFLMMFWKCPNIMLTMHISDVFDDNFGNMNRSTIEPRSKSAQNVTGFSAKLLIWRFTS